MNENIKIESHLQSDETELTNYAVSVSDFNEVCRTCLSRKNALKSFKELIENHNYSEDLLNIIGVDLSNSIYLPQNVCINCINDLEHIKKFANRSREIHNYLYNLAECTIKSEVSVILNESEEECNEQTESDDDSNQQLIPDQIFVPERKDEEWYKEEAANYNEEDPFSSTININTNRGVKRRRKKNLGMDKSITLNKKVKGKYCWNGYFHIKDKNNKEGSIQFWRCENKNKGCKGRIWTSVCDGSFISEKQVHTCKYVTTQTSVTINDVQSECDEQIESNDDINQELVQIFVPECSKDAESYDEETTSSEEEEEEDPFSSTIEFNTKSQDSEEDRTKPFVCNRCFKAFPYKSHLKRHRKTVTCQKTNKCDICGVSFAQWVYLAAHKKRHETCRMNNITYIN